VDSVPLRDWLNEDALVWRFPLFEQAPKTDAPEAWVAAFGAVARDLQCLRYGRAVTLDGLLWELIVNDEYYVIAGWHRPEEYVGDVGGFGIGHGLVMDAPVNEATVWVADVVQNELAGYEFVQWPSEGKHPLLPRLREQRPVWANPHTEDIVAPIGELCPQQLVCSGSACGGSVRTGLCSWP